jgi:hypothetical protein
MQDAMRNVAHIVEKDIRKSTQNLELIQNDDVIEMYYLDKNNSRVQNNTGQEIKFSYELKNRLN